MNKSSKPGKYQHKLPVKIPDTDKLDIRYRFIEEELKKVDAQNKTIIMRLNTLEKKFDDLTLQLLQTLKAMASLKGEDYTPSTPSEQQILDHINHQGARVVRRPNE